MPLGVPLQPVPISMAKRMLSIYSVSIYLGTTVLNPSSNSLTSGDGDGDGLIPKRNIDCAYIPTSPTYTCVPP